MAGEDRGLAEWAAAEVLAETPAPAPVAAAVAPPPAAPAPEPAVAVEPTAAVVESAPEPAAAEDAPPAPPPAPPTETVAAEPEPEPTPPPAPTPPKSKIQPLPEWMKDRLGESTAKQRAAEAKAAEELAQRQVFEAENRALRERLAAAGIAAPVAEPAPEPAPAPTAPVVAAPPAPVPPRVAAPAAPLAPPPGFVPVSQVQAEAQRIAAETAFNEKANAAYEAGLKAYPDDFKDAVGVLQGMDLAGRPDFQQAAMATGAMHDVIHHLGSNQEVAEGIRRSLLAGDMPKAIADMTKIAVSIDAQRQARLVADSKKPKASAAPAPIRPVGGSALPPQVDMDKLGDEEFTVELNKMLREKGIM